MKGFLTFTLAAGVALTTSSVSQAAGPGKGAMNVSKTPSVSQSPVGIGGLGVTSDRATLTRELDRINQLLAAPDVGAEELTNTPVQQKGGGLWSF